MRKRDVKRQLNKGFSLIELVVVILVMSVVMGIVIVFMSTARNSYEKVETEAVLQSEGEFTSTMFEKLTLEATNYFTDGVSVAAFGRPDGATTAVVVLDPSDNCLYYGNVDTTLVNGSNVDGYVSSIKGDPYCLLAKHVTSVEFPDSGSFDGLFKIKVEFLFNSKSYTTNVVTTARNIKPE